MKGISQVIVSVLLLAVALSVAGIYTKWAPELAGDATGKAADQTENQIKCRNAGIYLKDADYDKTGNNAEISIENTGTIALYNDITLVAINSSKTTGSTTIAELEVDEEQSVVVRSEKTPEVVAATSKECPGLKSSIDSINVTK